MYVLVTLTIHSTTALNTTVCENFDNKPCSLPNCYCYATKIPGNITLEDTPQMILFTYSGVIDEDVKRSISSVFADEFKNPNGCPIGITIFASNRRIDYCSVHHLYVRGHEIATYGINGTNIEGTKNIDWTERFLTHKFLLTQNAHIEPPDHLVGARAPEFRLGGESQFEAIQDGAFKYDSSIKLISTDPIWPFTLDMDVEKFLEGSCVQQKDCPKTKREELWEVPIVPLTRDNVARKCYILDECVHSNAKDVQVAETLENNLKRFSSKRAPFIINLREQILKSEHAKEGIRIFINKMTKNQDIWFLTISEMLDWVRYPSKKDKMKEYEPWDCPERNYFPACERACFKKTNDKSKRRKNPFRDLLPVESLWLYQTIILIVSFLVIYRMDKMDSKK